MRVMLQHNAMLWKAWMGLPACAPITPVNSVPALMARGAVFTSCHMAIGELAEALI